MLFDSSLDKIKMLVFSYEVYYTHRQDTKDDEIIVNSVYQLKGSNSGLKKNQSIILNTLALIYMGSLL